MRLLSIGVMVHEHAACWRWPARRGRSTAELKRQVVDSERAFAATMRARDLAGLQPLRRRRSHFLLPARAALRGRAAIVDAWRSYFAGPTAPFSWEPDQVEVVDSGTLAYSGGPVRDRGGKVVGRFNSIWRLEAPGQWKMVFDRGENS